ncbi:MAG: hypothetical protein H0W69_07375 [Gemmatimonadaceae bacterium]|nr:hypothetical protein [Gemmatimonadaceae bacterium]
MRDAFFRLPPLVASIIFAIGLLVLSYVVGMLLGDPGLDAVTLTMSLALGIDMFVLMRNQAGTPRFGTPAMRSLVLVLLLIVLAAGVTLFYSDKRPFWMNILAALGASIPGFLAISRRQAFPIEKL